MTPGRASPGRGARRRCLAARLRHAPLARRPASGRDGAHAAAAGQVAAPSEALTADLDAIFASPPLARALTAVQVVSLSDGRSSYALNAGKLVMPASNMKLVTVAVAAARLGWDFRFDTRLEAVGSVEMACSTAIWS